MKVLTVKTVMLCLLLATFSASSFSQQKGKNLHCKNEAFAALIPLPRLTYSCPQDITGESDDRILASSERKEAIQEIVKKLKALTQTEWWATPVEDLNVCYLQEKPGALSAEEKEQYSGPEYQVKLLGDNRIRLVLIADPCYQTYYNGANAYLLYKKGKTVYVTEVLNGYYSRLAKSVSMKLFRTKKGPLIRIETVNLSGMRPEITSYYFVIDKQTNAAIPRTGIIQGRKRTR